MKPDFSGWATKALLKCTDGRTIMPNAFQHQDQITVPLVWQHGHSDPENVLGHVLLTNKEEGVWADAFFNNTPKAQHMKEAVAHKDIKHMSIWANDLVEKFKQVLHGAIREVSLVLSGANPGATIESVTIQHSDGDQTVLDDEAIIYTGLEITLEHSDATSGGAPASDAEDQADGGADEIEEGDSSIQDVLDTMTPEQMDVMHYLIGEALLSSEPVQHSNTGDGGDQTKGTEVKHNVFEDKDKGGAQAPVLSHSDVQGIIGDAMKRGSLKEAVEDYALQHGIEDIDVLFPEVRLVDGGAPEFDQRVVAWVGPFMAALKKSPFSRIKSWSADIRYEEARAKGYIKGTMKKEEFFSVSKRVTTPGTVYKKQKLDRDDIIDITDFDVVMWMKGEMRVMLDEELAVAILIGDGREVDDEDKIDETHIRPIAKDDPYYTITVAADISTDPRNAIDAVLSNRRFWKGTGTPNFYTTEVWISKVLLVRNALTGERLYKTLADVAAEMRVAEIVPVEALEREPDIIGIMVNPSDYNVGADKGGEVNMFDFFDIDFNQYKYLIETRVSGALTKIKSAMVLRATAGGDVAATPEAPTYDATTHEVTVPDTTGVVYTDQSGNVVTDTTISLDAGENVRIFASAATGHYLTEGLHIWAFMRPPS